MSRVLVFDLEICLDPETNGGWGAARQGECGFSIGCVYDSQFSRPFIYWGHQIADCLAHLNTADTLVTFNGVDFDVPIMEALTTKPLEVPHHLDLLREITKVTKTRKGYGLGDLGVRCLGRPKIGSGKDPIEWFEKEQWDKLAGRCISDVLLTRDLYNHLIAARNVVGPNGERTWIEIPGDKLI